jgi:hypothetical protein
MAPSLSCRNFRRELDSPPLPVKSFHKRRHLRKLKKQSQKRIKALSDKEDKPLHPLIENLISWFKIYLREHF